jgi:hypothetical protein
MNILLLQKSFLFSKIDNIIIALDHSFCNAILTHLLAHGNNIPRVNSPSSGPPNSP